MNLSFLRPLAVAATLSFSALGSASAAEYTTLDAQTSRISFGYSQMSVTMDGQFGDIKAKEFSFDPQSPETAKVTIEVALASVDAGYEEANAELEKNEWLDLATYPLASFQSNNVLALGENHYQVTGALSIKGNTKEVTVPFTFKEEDGTGVFEGKLTFQRADFNIGDGQWKDFSIVANDIQIKFHIVGKP